MSFELESLPDLIVHAQCRLETTAPLAIGARLMGTIDLSGLSFYERPDVACAFGLILSATLEPVPGLLFRALDHRRRAEPARANDLALRYDIQRLLAVEIENVSGAALEITPGAPLTIVGIPGAVTPVGFTAAATASAGAATGNVRVVSVFGVVLSQNWQALSS